MDEKRTFFKKLTSIREFMLLIIIVTTFILMTILSPIFLTPENLLAVLLGLSVQVIVAIGMTNLMVSGGFDLSVGSVMALSGAICAMCLLNGVSIVISILLGLLVGVAVGFLNGFIVAILGINPFITTLGTMMGMRGVLLVITGAKNVYGLPELFLAIAQTKMFGIQSLTVIAIVLMIIGDIILRKTRFFRQNYYIGSNERSANLSGINVKKMKIFNYVLSGILAALAGVLFTSRLNSASTTAGVNLEFQVITAVIIGGASLNGGEGTVLGAFLGALIMGLVSDALTLLGVEVYWNQVVIGSTLLLAVIIDHFNQKRKATRGA